MRIPFVFYIKPDIHMNECMVVYFITNLNMKCKLLNGNSLNITLITKMFKHHLIVMKIHCSLP